jgi:FolB domain-containing protein
VSELDRIYIRDLQLRCIVGLNDWEREKRQDVLINVVMHADLSRAGSTDSIEDSVDYKDIKHRIISLVESSEFYLIERLAQAIADLALEDPMVKRVDVTLDKPGALRFARSVAVEISRAR